jgi:hypothetical protein
MDHGGRANETLGHGDGERPPFVSYKRVHCGTLQSFGEPIERERWREQKGMYEAAMWGEGGEDVGAAVVNPGPRLHNGKVLTGFFPPPSLKAGECTILSGSILHVNPRSLLRSQRL